MKAATTAATPNLTLEAARQSLRRLGLYGLLAQAETLMQEPWFARVIDIENAERARRSLKRSVAIRSRAQTRAAPVSRGCGI
jgi:hypothetical protein